MCFVFSFAKVFILTVIWQVFLPPDAAFFADCTNTRSRCFCRPAGGVEEPPTSNATSRSRSRDTCVHPPATFREEMAARGGFQTAPTGAAAGAMGPGPPVPVVGPGMGPGAPSGRMVPSPAAQNHMYRSPMPGPGYPVRYGSIFAPVALASPLEQSLFRLLCHRRLVVTVNLCGLLLHDTGGLSESARSV